ncbi:MAG: YjbQ family protein [Armatimonadetes bacterium]|nr:YjbQ family protein [Armatimonadota bacterium]
MIRMGCKTVRTTIPSRGNGEIQDITVRVNEAVASSELNCGLVTVFVSGSTAGVTTIEYEQGLLRDFSEALERLVPKGIPYAHHAAWHDDNGHSHVRASLLGPSLSIPFAHGKPTLGTWQQIVLVDFDTQPRQRELIIQILGE